MQTFLIAGGAGFIGSHLCEKLLNDGSKIICVDNLITGSRNNIEAFKNNSNFIFIKYDITQNLKLPDEIDGIFHLASPASPNKKSPRSYITYPIETLLANSIGTYNLLNLAKEKRARFVYASSSEVYGNPSVSPQDESYFGNVSPNGIRSVYDEGKRFGEAMTMAYFRKYDLDTRIMRIFNTYGDRMQKDDGRVVSNFINQAIKDRPITVYGNGSQTRSFCFIDDLIDGITRLMISDKAKGQFLNLGNPDEYTIIEMANIIKNLTKSNSEIVFEQLPEDDPLKRKPDIGKAIKLLGFAPKVALAEGLKKTIEYFKHN
ncbi:MAG: NAD-dependent dehydratase [Candidatus Levybacteria bacterium RIFCSPHIGHO2_01_FULL_36_15]|nr:MAG: NAD-dependent dehydratase [Candidatus Levybacteria bacterium RIFCSPHIGHO2_01_FULL_36_15]OGH38437.1 MAG: NAD-dependent dehydratase [Candidatus Levybacteria bacterium RIFCSPLOWO2_01_FULL_36_10]